MSRRTTCFVAAALLSALAGCASGDSVADDDATASPSSSPSDSATSSSPAPSESPSDDRVRGTEITVTVRDGEVSPSPRRVDIERDNRVRLVVTSDVADEVHVHGFDVEKNLDPGKPTTVEFVADQSGIFEVETHDSALELLQLAVR